MYQISKSLFMIQKKYKVKKNLTIKILLFAILVSLVIDILIRIFYASNLYLKFDPQVFNYIATPIISLLGFIGLIITILISINQVNLQISNNYFNYYRDYLNKILIEKKEHLEFTTSQILNFPFYIDDKYSELKKHPAYFTDLAQFRLGASINSKDKDYDLILGNVRLFRVHLGILLNQYKSIIHEINMHKSINQFHKDVLFKELFDTQISQYTIGLWLVESEMKEQKDNLYIAFSELHRDNLPFFDKDIYELKEIIEKDKDLKKYLEVIN